MDSSDGFTNFEFRIYEYLSWFLFQLANWERKALFGPIRNLFSFSAAQRFVDKIGGKKWWKHAINSLDKSHKK